MYLLKAAYLHLSNNRDKGMGLSANITGTPLTKSLPQSKHNNNYSKDTRSDSSNNKHNPFLRPSTNRHKHKATYMDRYTI